MTDQKAQASQPNEKQKEIMTMWNNFVESCRSKGFTPEAVVNFKKDVVDGITMRERRLCEIITNTYLEGNIQMKPIQPVAQPEPPKTETPTEEKTIEKLEDNKSEPEKNPKPKK